MDNASRLIITDAMIQTPMGLVRGDVVLEDGQIHDIVPGGGSEIPEGAHHIEATGLHLLPGIIDPQVHFREPGQPEKEDLASGSAAAASGGVTSFLDMPNNNPSATTLASMRAKLDSAARKCVTHHGFFIGATPTNLDDLIEAVGTPEAPVAHPGVCGIKIFMGSSTGDLLVNGESSLRAIFEGTAGLIAVHAEDEARLIERRATIEGRTDMAAHAEWRDDECALLATKLAVRLAEETGHRLHVLHLTSGLEASWLKGRTGRPSDGARITVETCPQHLTFDDEDVAREGTRLKMNPPIRYASDKAGLWKGLQEGTIQCIATDHAPHTLEAKSLGFPMAPSGMPGVESSLPVMLDHVNAGRCTLAQVSRWMSEHVADCYGMVGKGRIEIGADADLVLVDLNLSIQVEDEHTWTRVGWSPYRGRTLKGWPVLTIVDGIPVFERTEHTGPKGRILVEPGTVGRPLTMLPWT